MIVWPDMVLNVGHACTMVSGTPPPPACQSEGMTVRSSVAFNAVLRICPQSPLGPCGEHHTGHRGRNDICIYKRRGLGHLV